MTTSLQKRQGQIQRGIVPTGYQLTPLGIRPANWTMCRIGDCLKRVERPVKVQPDAMYTQIGIRSHGKGLFYKEPVTGKELGNKAVFWIEPDCFILNIVFAWEQAIGKTTKAETGMVGSHRFPMYRPVKGRVDIDYLIDFFLTKRGADILEAASPGGAGRNKTLGQSRFLQSKIVLPPLNEQRKIVTILAIQDKIIELLNRKIALLKLLRQSWARKMFPHSGGDVPEVRFPGFTGAWKRRRLSDIADIIGGGTPNTTVTTYWDGNIDWYTPAEISDQIFVDSSQRKISSDGLMHSAAKLLPVGSVLFTSRAGIGKGAILAKEGCTNQGFQSLVPHKNTLDSYFIFSRLAELKRYGEVVGKGSTFLEVSGTQMARMELMMPSTMEEQIEIGKFFRKFDSFIALHQRRLAAEEEKKKALMQLLLTGIVRV